MAVAWRQIVLETLVLLKAWRSWRADDDRLWSFAQAAVLHEAACQRALQVSRTRLAADHSTPKCHLAVIDEFRLRITAENPVPSSPVARQLPSTATTHLLLFAGDTHRNPGPGGAGAVLVRYTPASGEASIVWSSAVCLDSSSMTPNQAAFQGLLAGLRAALSHRLDHVEVGGSNGIILRLLRTRHPPRRPHLRRLYDQARAHADRLGVCRWHHLPRSELTMANALATHAMNSRASAHTNHPTSLDGHSDLRHMLATDLRPWWSIQTDYVER